MKTLATFLPIQNMLQRAKELGVEFWDRWDVPHGKNTTKDLDDKPGQLPVMKDGRTRASMLLPEETRDQGKFNPVIVLLAALLPVLASLVGLGSAMPSNAGWMGGILQTVAYVGVFAVAWVMRECRETVWSILQSVGVSFGLPLVGLALATGGASGSVAQNIVAKGHIIALVWVGALVFLAVAQLMTVRAKHPLSEMVTFTVSAIIILGVSQLMPWDWAVFPACLIIGAMAPRRIVKSWIKHRLGLLAAFGTTLSGTGTWKNLTAHVQARADQARRALADKTPLIYFAKSLGTMYERGYVYAAQKGKDMVMSLMDMSTHLMIFGKTGTGKTSYIFNWLITQFLIIREGGFFYIDPKGEGAKEWAHIPDFTVVTPRVMDFATGQVISDGVDLNLLKGIKAGQVTEILADVCMKEMQDSKGNDAHFVPSGKHHGIMCEHLLWALIEAKKKNGEYTLNDMYFWNINPLQKFIHMVGQPASPGMSRRMVDPVLDYIEEHCPDGDRNETLNRAIEWARVTVPRKLKESEKEWASVMSTIDVWFNQVLNHEHLVAWCNTHEDQPDLFDIGSVEFGARMGLYLPPSFHTAGKLATGLLRYRVAKSVRGRGNDWRKKNPDMRPVMFFIDECQEALTPLDLEIAAMGRSLGAWLVCATQSYDALVQRMDKESTDAMLHNFRSTIALDVDKLTFEHLTPRVGKCIKRVTEQLTPAIDFLATNQNVAAGPLMDWEHPNYGKHWEHLAAQGYGQAVPGKVQYRNTQTGRSEDSNYEETMDHYQRHNLFTNVVTMNAGKEEYVLEQSDFDAMSQADGNALLILQRGGTKRAEFVKFNLFPVPTLEQYQAMEKGYRETGKIDPTIVTRNINKE